MSEILLIDLQRPEFGRWLESTGHHVLQAADWAAAGEVQRASESELVIARTPAPEEEAQLETILHGPGQPGLILLAKSQRLEDARIGFRLGAADVLPSDPTSEMLSEAVNRALARRASLFETATADPEFAGSEPYQLPRAIVDAACKVLRADDASLMLIGADQRLHLAYSCGLSSEFYQEISIALGERVAGRIAQSGTPALIGGSVEEDPRFNGVNSEPRRKVGSSIVFPLKHGERLLGVLNLNRKNGSVSFASSDLARTSVFAAQVVLALENVRLLKQVAAGEGMHAVGRIAAAVAHEINNPTGWVLSNLGYLRDELHKPEMAREEMQGAIEDAFGGMHRIRDIVRDFQTLIQGDGAQSYFDLNEAIRAASRIAGAVIHGAAVTLDLQSQLTVMGSRSRLSQAFVNLIVNAGSEESPGRTISIRSHREGALAVATVADTGRGITAAQLATLFDPIFGARGPRSAGLGLSISRDIVRDHGGDLVVHSQEGEGTVLTVRLPSEPG